MFGLNKHTAITKQKNTMPKATTKSPLYTYLVDVHNEIERLQQSIVDETQIVYRAEDYIQSHNMITEVSLCVEIIIKWHRNRMLRARKKIMALYDVQDSLTTELAERDELPQIW